MPISKGTDKESVFCLYNGLRGPYYIKQNTHSAIKKIKWESMQS